jgi:hypothetical protein
MPEKGCLQDLQALYPYQPTCFLNSSIEDICVYVNFNKIMLSLQNFYGVSACRNAPLKSLLHV